MPPAVHQDRVVSPGTPRVPWQTPETMPHLCAAHGSPLMVPPNHTTVAGSSVGQTMNTLLRTS